MIKEFFVNCWQGVQIVLQGLKAALQTLKAGYKNVKRSPEYQQLGFLSQYRTFPLSVLLFCSTTVSLSEKVTQVAADTQEYLRPQPRIIYKHKTKKVSSITEPIKSLATKNRAIVKGVFWGFVITVVFIFITLNILPK